MCDYDDYGVGDAEFLGDEFVFRRVHDDHLLNGELTDAHWPTKQWTQGLSGDWSAIGTPEETVKHSLGNVLCIKISERRSPATSRSNRRQSS